MWANNHAWDCSNVNEGTPKNNNDLGYSNVNQVAPKIVGK